MSRFSIDWSELSLQVMITFGHFLWQACVIGVVLLVVQHVAELLRDSRYLLRLRRGNVSLGETDLRGANIRYTIACVAFFSLPIFVIATFAWVHQSRGPIMLVASNPVESPSSPVVSASKAIPPMADSDISVLPPSATPMSAGVPFAKPIEPATLVVEPQTSPVERIQAFAPYLLLAYIVGVGFMLARFSLSIIGSSRLRRTIQPITDVKLLSTIAEQCARVGLKRIPIVALCQRVSVPVVVGIVKPMILLPPALLCGLDPNQVAAILSHEIAHIRRYDLVVNFLQRIVEALLFFHPVTWWISRRVSIERENCCDDIAAACMGRLPYAGALLQMAELCIGNDRRRLAALATLSATGSNSTDLGYRIRRLIGAEVTARVGFTRRSFSIGLSLVSLLTVSLVAWGQSQKSEVKNAEVAIQWSRFGDENGLLSGARLILPKDGLKPGEPLLVEYRLANVSKEKKTLKCYLNKGMRFTSLRHGNRISGFGLDREREPVTLTIEPGEVFIDTEHLVSIDTTGLEPGEYQAALGSAFFYPDSVEPNTTHELPHRGSIPFTIVGESATKVIELPKSEIHWGKPIAGLQVGARFAGDPTAYSIGATIEAELFVANVTDQPIECSVVLPHPRDGWLFNVEDSNGSTIMLQRPMRFSSPFPQEYVKLKLAPGEVTTLTKDQDKKDGTPSRPRPKFELADKETEEQGWSDYTIKGRLVTQGGTYSAIFDVVIIRPEIPALRLELDTGNVPFSVGLQGNKPIDIFGTSELKDEDVAAFVDKTLTKPYRPNLGRGSWQLGAHEYSIILTLESIPQQQLVADALMKKIEFSHGSSDIHARKLAMDYCAQNFPDRLLPYLVRRLSATDFPEPDLSTSGQAFPSYYELTVLGDLGEQGKAAIPALMKHLSAGDPIAREATIRSLVRVGPSDPEVMQSLSKCFNDSNVRVQGTAVYQAGRYGELAKPLGPKFVELLEAKSKEVQFWAAAALITSKFNPDLGFERLLAGAKAGERKDRRQALTTLAMLGSRSLAITPELRSMLNDTDPEVVREVRETIRRIETNDRIVTHAEEAVQKAAARELVSVVAENPANRQTAGALKGRVTVDGVVPLLSKLRVPPPKSLRLSRRPTDEELRKFEASLVEIDDESIQVNADQGLANAFVYLAKVPSNWQPTQEDLKPFTLTIQDYRFEPRAAIVRTGQDVRLNNPSDEADNFAFEPMKNGGQNRAVEAGSEITLKHPFTITERTPVQAKSHIHPWKAAFLLPLDHPFAVITDKQGRFSIEGLPPGEHSFLIWHERTGWLEKSLVVNIEAGQTTEVNRSYSVDRFRFVANKNQTDVIQQSSEEKPDSSKQSFKLIDGETGKPLQGLKCRAIFAKLNTPPRYQACTTDEHGLVEVDVAKDESAGIAEVPSGWFSNGFGPVYVVVVPDSEQQPQPNAEKKNDEPALLKLWRGTEVDGRLLWPDKTPAAGVKLMAGVYINHQSWKEKLGMDLTRYSFDHGDWPNWSRTIVTDDDGNFRVTVPPKDARFWLRIGTTQLGFGPQINVGEDEAVTQRLAKCVPLEIQYGASSRGNIIHIVPFDPSGDDMFLHVGELILETGVIVRGRVVDAEGKGLSNVHLTSTGPHGPHSGRSATSGEDGKFEFPALAAGNLTVHPDARLRDVTKPIHEQVISRDVQAVFVDQSFTIIRSWVLPHEITVRAVPHTEVTFEWVDRRADKTQPIAFYGAFRVSGYMPDENGKPATYWTSETERVERDGKQWLTVKIPTQLLKPDLMLAADSKVTASYSDSTGVTSGPGIVELGDITATTTRTIFGDEPHEPESPQAKKKEQSPSKSESAVRKRIHDLGGTMEVRERNGDTEEVRLNLMSKDKLASDEDLKLFATLKNLTRLEFRADHITSQGLDHISLMTNLENLHLWDCGLSDDDVGKLTNLKQLQWLGLYNCRNVSDRSAQHLLQLPKLHSLNLYGTPITASFLQAIQGPRIRFLDLRRTGIIPNDLSVIEKFPNLRQINLPDEVTDADLSHLSGLSELKILTLQDINISDKGLLHLKALTKVETLYLRNTQITDEGLSHILDMQNLETLDLAGTQISSAGLLPLATLPKLQTLDLQRTQIDDDALKQLAQFSRVQFLDLQDTNTTEAAVTALRNARPKMEIQWSN